MRRMRSKSKIAVAAVTAAAMVFTLMPGFAFAGEESPAEPVSATITFSAGTAEGFDVFPKEKLVVADNLTETYYPDVTVEPKGQVTVSDAIVAAHIEKYGQAYKENPTAYYDVEDGYFQSGTVKKQFGHEFVGLYYGNGKKFSTGVCLATVADGDVIETGVFSDDKYADVYSSFESRNYRTEKGKAVSVKLQADIWDESVLPCADATIMLIDKETGRLTAQGAVTDKAGNASLVFDKAGTYYVSATGTVTYNGYTGEEVTGNIIAPYAEIQVTETKSPAPAKLKTPVIKVKAGKKCASVSWKKVAGAKGYQVYRAASKNGAYKKIADVSAKKTSVKATKLKSKKTYYFKVRAYSKTAKSSFSKVKSAKIK